MKIFISFKSIIALNLEILAWKYIVLKIIPMRGKERTID
jgi:hypothetical protein